VSAITDAVATYKSILVPLDGSPFAERALRTAAHLATRLNAELHLVAVSHTVFADDLSTAALAADAARQQTAHYLEQTAAWVRTETGVPTAMYVLDGPPASAIVAQVPRVGADLIVMATHGRTGASRFWLGSVADSVIRAATVPVLLIRATEATAEKVGDGLFERVLVPLDGSSSAESVLPHAIALAGLTGGNIHLLRVEELTQDLRASVWQIAEDERDDLPERLDAAYNYLRSVVAQCGAHWKPTTVSVDARGAHRIAEAIVCSAIERDADLIAMCTHGRGASRLLIGSVADKVIRGTQCHLLITRAR
jgi:nucleotide-binding universal stress UspA family protein